MFNLECGTPIAVKENKWQKPIVNATKRNLL